MEKYKFRSTVYLVFLLASLFINGVLLYMLIVEDSPVVEVFKDNVDYKLLVNQAKEVYDSAYNTINKEDNNFYITEYPEIETTLDSCVLINFHEINEYFTNKAIAKLSEDLVLENGNYFYCDNQLLKKMSLGFFDYHNQTVRELRYVASDDTTLIVSSKLDYDGITGGDVFPLYMILKYENGKWLIDSFE